MFAVAYRHALLWFPPIIYAALIYNFSSESDPLPALTPHLWDKGLHAIEYTGLGFLVFRALHGERVKWPLAITLAIVGSSAYAGSDEWHQLFVPARSSSVLDWVADTVGTVIGVAVYIRVAAATSWRFRQRHS
jgi:VanZ family protein